MNKFQFLSWLPRILKLNVLPAIAASFLSAQPLFAQSATDHITSVGVILFYSTTFNDGCRVGNVYVQGNAGVVVPKQTSLVAYVTISGQDTCHGNAPIGFFGSAQTGVQLASQGDANGTKAPTSATMYGQVTSDDGTDTATFNLDLTAAGLEFYELDTNKVTFPLSATQSVTIQSHSDASQVLAVGSLTLSTQKLGTIPVSAGSGDMEGSRNSEVTITH